MHFLVVTIIFIIKIGSCYYLDKSNYLRALLLKASLHGSPFSLFQWNLDVNLYTSLYNRITSIFGNFFCFITKCSIGLFSICYTILALDISYLNYYNSDNKYKIFIIINLQEELMYVFLHNLLEIFSYSMAIAIQVLLGCCTLNFLSHWKIFPTGLLFLDPSYIICLARWVKLRVLLRNWFFLLFGWIGFF